MNVIITAAGNGSRFTKQNIKIPKYMIQTNQGSLLHLSLCSLKNFFDEHFIFIFQKQYYNEQFVKSELKSLNINNFDVVLLDKLTSGQAQTVIEAKKFIKCYENILIYNIDTYTKSRNILKTDFKDYYGYIYAIKASGNHWSFIKTKWNKVIEVKEKIRISNKASIGLYYFKSFDEFEKYYNIYKTEIIANYKEAYIAPIYNYMIKDNKFIGYKILNKKDFFCLGTPEELAMFDQNYLERNVFYEK